MPPPRDPLTIDWHQLKYGRTQLVRLGCTDSRLAKDFAAENAMAHIGTGQYSAKSHI